MDGADINFVDTVTASVVLPSLLVLEFASPLEWTAACLAVLAGATVQGTIGLGLAIVSVPILTLIDPTFVPVPVQLIAVLIAAAQLVRERKALDVRGAGLVLVGRVPGAALGLWLLSNLSETTLGLTVGLVVLFGVAAMAFGWSIPITRSSQVLTGVASGAMGLSTGVGGPPLGMLYRNQSGPELRATLGAVFTLGITINVTTLALAGRVGPTELTTAAILLIPLAAGFALSSWVARRVPARVLREGVLVVSALAALTLLGSLAFGG